MESSKVRKQNRLSAEKSPYLLQHQHNPVDWYPWGDEAFGKARRENKPVFLSIGYSTCHWCHVMERESFENETIAAALNRDFICIKVDREERPDVDRIYMNFVQATTGHGGWPLNVFLTPDLKPFFGGTYWPPEKTHGRAGILDILEQVAGVWKARQHEVLESAASIHRQIETATASLAAPPKEQLSAETLEKAANLFLSVYDSRHGGFGGAPKFPQPSIPRFLLRHAHRTGNAEARQMVLHTCDRMAAGGIYDQLGGGFARYSVDAEWLVPHFEKMLYDNAQLSPLYLEAFLLGGHSRHANMVHGILDYVLRDMTHADGGFYSAEDADSEGHEGKFYCWTVEEVERLLTPKETVLAKRYFGMTPEGNFVDHSHPAPLRHQNVLHIAEPGMDQAEATMIETIRSKMLDARSKRVRPHLDDKVLASWNGLMMGAFARAGAVLNSGRYLDAARKNAAFVQDNLWRDGVLYHRWRDGECDSVELLESHAFLLDGLLDLYEATLDAEPLSFAIAIAERMLTRFYDSEHGGFWQSADDSGLILRLKPDYDGAEPSGNSAAVMGLLRLGAITEREHFLAAARKTLEYFSGRLLESPQALPVMLSAFDFHLNRSTRIVFAGDVASAQGRLLLSAAHSVFNPGKALLGTDGPVHGFAQSLRRTGPARAFVCSREGCKTPTEDPNELIRQLREVNSGEAQSRC